VHLNPDAVFAALIAFDAAAIVVLYNSDSLSSRSHWSHQLKSSRFAIIAGPEGGSRSRDSVPMDYRFLKFAAGWALRISKMDTNSVAGGFPERKCRLCKL